MINILWVDDESIDINGNLTAKGDSFKSGAYEEGIYVKAFNQYKDALHELELHPTWYTAIVLDVEDDRASDGDKKDGYLKAKDDIRYFQGKMNQNEPYIFTFTGHDKHASGDYQADSKKDYASKAVYLKGSDREILFKDIKKVAENSRLYQVFKEYEAVLNIAKGKLDDECFNLLMEIVYRLDYKQANNDASLLNNIRKVFAYCINHAPVDYPKVNTKNEPISMNEKCVFIGKQSNISPYIQRHYHSLCVVTNIGSHGSDELENGKTTDFCKMMPVAEDVMNGKAPYLLRACMYELFDIILWINQK